MTIVERAFPAVGFGPVAAETPAYTPRSSVTGMNNSAFKRLRPAQ